MSNRKKPRQIKFYSTEEQFQAIQSLRVLKNMTVQDLMTEAVDALVEELGQLEDVERDMAVRKALSVGIVPAMSESFMLRKGEKTLMDLWLNCIRCLPDATVFAFRQIMQDSLRFFESSRLKPKKLLPVEGEYE